MAAAYTSWELEFSFNGEDFKKVNRLFSSKSEVLEAGVGIIDLKDDVKSAAIRIRKLEHD